MIPGQAYYFDGPNDHIHMLSCVNTETGPLFKLTNIVSLATCHLTVRQNRFVVTDDKSNTPSDSMEDIERFLNTNFTFNPNDSMSFNNAIHQMALFEICLMSEIPNNDIDYDFICNSW